MHGWQDPELPASHGTRFSNIMQQGEDGKDPESLLECRCSAVWTAGGVCVFRAGGLACGPGCAAEGSGPAFLGRGAEELGHET